ncbi:hypothetical protein OG884_05560 [Streptosporangium sp. NBC_01755]|uniref:hypothetical protein n=1 Tax=Streptosporangium sp. NBC_01755 TaxID=2975949 RepID=UPI002DD7A2EA|nr:hypothetical protein [Streptosporangium sp. NBC_01755]WSD01391.1 hypothetical protein OG884_05560 [Streptosporangium sp. NBC_01755]
MMLLTNDRVTELRTLYPAWTIFQSGAGRWWALRTGAISPAQRDLGITASLDADTLEDLAGQLAAQEQLRETA